MPRLAEIDPVEIPHLLPVVLVVDARTALVRLMGSETTAAVRTEMRGKSITTFDFGRFMPKWIEAFERVVAEKAPITACGILEGDRLARSIEAVLTPLSDDGAEVDHVFGGLLIQCRAPEDTVATRNVSMVGAFSGDSPDRTDIFTARHRQGF